MQVGPIGRLGRWSARHGRIVGIVWLVSVIGLGALAPQVEHALSGAGWWDSRSESVEAREVIQGSFAGNDAYALMAVVHSDDVEAGDPAFTAVTADAEAVLAGSDDVASVTPPQPGRTISRDGRTAVIVGGAASDPTSMVAAADDLKGELRAVGTESPTTSRANRSS